MKKKCLKKARHFLFLSVGVLKFLNIYFFFFFLLNMINIYKMHRTILYTVIHFSRKQTTRIQVQHGNPLLSLRTASERAEST